MKQEREHRVISLKPKRKQKERSDIRNGGCVKGLFTSNGIEAQSKVTYQKGYKSKRRRYLSTQQTVIQEYHMLGAIPE